MKNLACLTWILAFVVIGCGGSGGVGDVNSSQPELLPISTASIRIEHTTLAQGTTFPEGVDSVRITGSVSGIVGGVLTVDGGGTPYGPLLQSIAPSYLLMDVPTSVDFLRLEYLAGEQVRGLFVEPITLQPGEVYEILDPAIAARPSQVQDFEVRAHGFGGQSIPPGVTVPVAREVPWSSILRSTLAGGEQSDLLNFVYYRSVRPEIVQVANGGLVFGSSEASGTLVGQAVGTTKVEAIFFDLVKDVEVEVYDVFKVGFGTLRLQHGRPVGEGSQVQTEFQLNRFFAKFYPATWDDLGAIVIDGAPPYDATDLVEWYSHDPQLLEFDSSPNRKGYFHLGGFTGEVTVQAYFPQFRVWGEPYTIIIDEELLEQFPDN